MTAGLVYFLNFSRQKLQQPGFHQLLSSSAFFLEVHHKLGRYLLVHHFGKYLLLGDWYLFPRLYSPVGFHTVNVASDLSSTIDVSRLLSDGATIGAILQEQKMSIMYPFGYKIEAWSSRIGFCLPVCSLQGGTQ
ncbi:hypothetical protein AVEN_200650-1 [Araneus ventricosus]|uniref:Uncharacterized protein n=1 Tax=Araneus ventricosus TaxID=182803 RepID=A0A4Y2L9D2_ARAVE|nr:hypothetical protein AVEN_200650-1 [Araneus ventricosus]